MGAENTVPVQKALETGPKLTHSILSETKGI